MASLLCRVIFRVVLTHQWLQSDGIVGWDLAGAP